MALLEAPEVSWDENPANIVAAWLLSNPSSRQSAFALVGEGHTALTLLAHQQINGTPHPSLGNALIAHALTLTNWTVVATLVKAERDRQEVEA